MKKTKDTTKVIYTCRLKRILIVDRQPDSTDNVDKENASNTDQNADFIISSDEEEENECKDSKADNEVANAISWLLAELTI